MKLGFAMSLLLAAASAQAAPIVKVEGGQLSGVDASAAVQAYKGIPYARPPVGDLRWREPRPASSWQGVRAADQFGARCMQKTMWNDMFFRSPNASEDCLYLNVWTPANAGQAARAKLPVLVYVYGGGFIAGDSSEPRYDGAAMAAKGIVVVTMNYRLGVFGFLAHPQLTGESAHKASGNYGLMDQAAALAWVKRNIAAFGGDPKHITIGGESAGSMSVSALMVSPLSRGSIVGAIGESGSALTTKFTPRAQAEAAGMSFAEALQVPTVAQLRAIPADKLLEVQDYKGARFGPVIDGYFLPEAPADTYAAAKAARVPLLVGSNSQEGAAAAILADASPTVANYRAALVKMYGDHADAAFALYPVAGDADVIRVATDLASDRFLAADTWRWFDTHRRSGAPTYYYYYQRVRPQPTAYPAEGPPPYGAVHSAEIEYALGNLDANPAYAWTDEDRRVSATMSSYFANFIKAGDPNGSGLPLWARASADDKTIQRQIIDVDTRRALFVEQARYKAAETLPTP